MARARAPVSRRRRDPRRARPLVPGGSDQRRPRALGRPLALLQGALAPVAPGEGGTGAARPEGARPARRGHRPDQRFVERFRYKKNKAKQAQAKLTTSAGWRRSAAARRRRSTDCRRRSGRWASTSEAAAERPHRGRGLRPRGQGGRQGAPRRRRLCTGTRRHVALVGPNGSGKTTLLETMLGRRDGASGKVRLGHGVEAAYFSQQELELDERGTVLDCVQGSTGLPRQSAQNLLGRFLFSGWDEQSKPVTVLSGGERRRLALAIVVASGANFLVLDERPTTSTSRAARRWRLRSRPSPEQSCSSHTTARCSMPSPTGHSRSRTRPTLVRRRLGGVDRRREEVAKAAEPPEPKVTKKPKTVSAKPAGPTALQVVEADIEAGGERVAGSSASSRTTGAMRIFRRHRAARDERQAHARPLGAPFRNRPASSRLAGLA